MGKVSSKKRWKPKKAVESGMASSLKEMVLYCSPWIDFEIYHPATSLVPGVGKLLVSSSISGC